MSWFSGFRHRLHEALRPGRADRDLDDELRDHLAREVARQSADDVPPGEAMRRAALRVGGLQAAKEAVRDERTGHVLRDLVTDLRISARMARRNLGFTATIVVSLALGVGGTTAVFSVVNAVLVRPLPYPDPDRLFMTRVWWNSFSASLSPADLLALQEQSAGIASVGAYFVPEDDAFTMATPDGPTLVTGAVITADLPQVLGVRPVLGAGFSLTSTGTSTGPDAREALIGETLWRDRYGGAPDVIGRSITLEDTAFTIVGVMPVGFNVPGQRNGAVWQRAIVRQPTRRGPFYLNTISRLAPGVTAEAAASKLTAAVTPVLRDKYAVKPTWRYGLRTLRETLVGDVRRTLLLLFGAMALRAADRDRERHEPVPGARHRASARARGARVAWRGPRPAGAAAPCRICAPGRGGRSCRSRARLDVAAVRQAPAPRSPCRDSRTSASTRPSCSSLWHAASAPAWPPERGRLCGCPGRNS